MPNLPEAGRGANAPRLLGGAGGLPPARTRGSASIADVFKAGGSIGHREARERSERVYRGPMRKEAEHGRYASAPRV